MSKYIDADRLRAKIERRIDKLNPKTGMFGGRPMRDVNPKTFPRENELERVLDLIDYLQQEQPEAESENPVPDDLDKAARKSAVAPFNFELDEEHLYEYPYLPIAEQKFKEGAKWQREQMVREAVEADVNIYKDLAAGKSLAEFVAEMPTNNLGDKVRIIIVKD